MVHTKANATTRQDDKMQTQSIFAIFGLLLFCLHGCAAFTLDGDRVRHCAGAGCVRISNHRWHKHHRRVSSASIVSSVSEQSDDGGIAGEDTMSKDILMQIQMTLDNASDDGDNDNDNTVSIDDVYKSLSKFMQKFPFAAVLPVQPLQYLPTDDDGVDVRFLRKKTEEKGSIDGGIRFSIEQQEDGNSIQITARRNSEGQSVPKIFSEKLVITAFVSKIGAGPIAGASMSSVFHRWM